MTLYFRVIGSQGFSFTIKLTEDVENNPKTETTKKTASAG